MAAAFIARVRDFVFFILKKTVWNVILVPFEPRKNSGAILTVKSKFHLPSITTINSLQTTTIIKMVGLDHKRKLTATLKGCINTGQLG